MATGCSQNVDDIHAEKKIYEKTQKKAGAENQNQSVSFALTKNMQLQLSTGIKNYYTQ